MTMLLRRLCVPVAVALALVATSSAMASADPSATITDVQTQQGIVQYLFSVKDLAPNQHLDTNSVVVTAGGQTLDATAAVPDASAATTGPIKPPIREVILTLDVSGSMQGDGIAAARTAAIAYARSLPSDVRVGVVKFSDAPHVLLQPTTDRAQVASVVSGLQAGGNTALYDAVITAADLMKGLPSDASRRLVILSDGDDTTSTRSLADASHALTSDHVNADAIAFRIPGNPAVLSALANASHGRVIPASGAGDLAGAFAAIARQFDQQVLVTVQVPVDLANTRQTLLTSLNVGDSSLSASTTLDMPDARGAAKAQSGPAVSAPAGRLSNATLLLICAAVFVAFLIAALIAVWVPASSREQAKRNARLAEVNRYQLVGALGAQQQDAPSQQSEGQLTQRALAFVDRTVRSRGKRDRIVDELERAGLRMRPEEWVVLQASAVVVGGALVAVLIHSIFGFVIGALFMYFAARVFINILIGRRSNAFIDQLPDTLQLIAGSLRSGFSLSQALVGVVREGTEPTASEFSRTLTEVRLGAPLEDALDATATRMQCADLHWVVLAVRISREVGGNLAEVLQNTVGTMRERAQLRGQIRVLSAEGRISARILIALPFILAGYMLVFKKGYLSPLVHTGVGLVLVGVGSVLLVLGAFWISRLVKIEV